MLTILHRRESVHTGSAQLTRRVQSRPTHRVYILRPIDYSNRALSDNMDPDGVPSRERNRCAGMEAEKHRVNVMRGVSCVVLIASMAGALTLNPHHYAPRLESESRCSHVAAAAAVSSQKAW